MSKKVYRAVLTASGKRIWPDSSTQGIYFNTYTVVDKDNIVVGYVPDSAVTYIKRGDTFRQFTGLKFFIESVNDKHKLVRTMALEV